MTTVLLQGGSVGGVVAPGIRKKGGLRKRGLEGWDQGRKEVAQEEGGGAAGRRDTGGRLGGGCFGPQQCCGVASILPVLLLLALLHPTFC